MVQHYVYIRLKGLLRKHWPYYCSLFLFSCSSIISIFQLDLTLFFSFQTIGCDGIVGSEKRPDACGVCGGSNSTCQIVSGIFTEPQLPPGYNLVAQLPKGACHVNITEFKPSRNYLGKIYTLLYYNTQIITLCCRHDILEIICVRLKQLYA